MRIRPCSPRSLEILSVGLLIALLVGMGLTGPVLQPQDYHNFADSSGLVGLPNAIDVLSNLAFLIAGAFGVRLASRAPFPQQASLHLFSMGLVLTALGSAYYHWAPTDKTLLWDRLPMTLAFAGAIGAMASQYLREDAAFRWQNAWLYLGLVSVFLWDASGDLRLYLVTQVGGLLVGGVWLFAGRKPSVVGPAGTPALPWGFVWMGYGLAKLAESGDAWLWHATEGFVAGHGLKHVLAAAGTIPLWIALAKLEGVPAKK